MVSIIASWKVETATVNSQSTHSRLTVDSQSTHVDNSSLLLKRFPEDLEVFNQLFGDPDICIYGIIYMS